MSEPQQRISAFFRRKSVPPVAPPPGAGVYILVNANAKRGGRRVAVQLQRALPGSTVKLTRSKAQVEGWLRDLLDDGKRVGLPPRCILSAGGDGSAITLLDALDKVVPKGERFPVVGALPLGTGNAWAHALGARKLDHCVRALVRHEGELPTRRYALFECDGILTFFGGCGWDAQVLDDYRAQVESSPSNRVAKSVWGYLTAMLTRTVPQALREGRPTVRIENLGPDVHVVDDAGNLQLLEGAGPGTILYDGPVSVAGAATCPNFGYGFRAYPFAERLLDRLNVRVFDQTALKAVWDIPNIWRGQHPLRGMKDWFTTGVRMTFSRPVPLQIGGDPIGARETVVLSQSERHVEALDWRHVG